ncbi:MAG: GGDEF domain-containing protein [Spirochaetaceae bacterium]|jgi:diguanylate cyclase (GGDEF)-like protein|nr:GGDEF domain-containing protein [Spirochaetaceae bacterium]
MTQSPISDPVLINSPLFASMSELEFNAVTAFMERRRVAAGDTVFNEGDHGEDMFILLSGSLSAYKKQSDGTQRWMFDINPGSFLGEMSIIASEPRSATIKAKDDSHLMVLQGIDFYRIVFEHPMVGIKMLNSIGKVQNGWLNQSSRHLKDLVQWGETARRRAITDELTGLYNRNFLEESIKDRFKIGAVGARKMSLIMMDLDKVHEINDRYGPAGGDQVIIAVANVLKTMGRPGDIVARLSGDEFAVLLPDTDGHDAVTVAEKIREKVSNQQVPVPKSPGAPDTEILHIRTSMGVAVAPTQADNVRDLVFVADTALRRAKELGRNRVELAQ